MDHPAVYSFNMHSAYGHIDLPSPSSISVMSPSKRQGYKKRYNQNPRKRRRDSKLKRFDSNKENVLEIQWLYDFFFFPFSAASPLIRGLLEPLIGASTGDLGGP